MKYVIAIVAITFGSLFAAAPAIASPINEDDASWDCTTMGNQICGPINTQGVPAGQYDNGTLVTPWLDIAPASGECRDICLGA